MDMFYAAVRFALSNFFGRLRSEMTQSWKDCLWLSVTHR